MNDIECNFLISSEGIFEGRGWNSQPEVPFKSNDIVIGHFGSENEAVFNDLLDGLIATGTFLGKINQTFDFTRVEDLFSLSKDFIVTNEEWGGKDLSEKLKPFTDKIELVVVTDTTSRSEENCETKVGSLDST